MTNKMVEKLQISWKRLIGQRNGLQFWTLGLEQSVYGIPIAL